MNEFLKMDIFFAITTFVVAFWGIIGIIALYYIIRILKNIDRLSQLAVEEADELRDDIADIRSHIRDEGIRFKSVVDFFSHVLVNPTKRSRK